MNDKLRAAMQQAMEALEELFHSNSTKVAVEKYNTAHNALREALSEQAKQEPVAEVRVRSLRGNESVPKIDVEWLVRPTPGFLYAAPVRTKDLTDDEINKISNTIANAMPANMTVEDWKRSFARAVIAVDREKNK